VDDGSWQLPDKKKLDVATGEEKKKKNNNLPVQQPSWSHPYHPFSNPQKKERTINLKNARKNINGLFLDGAAIIGKAKKHQLGYPGGTTMKKQHEKKKTINCLDKWMLHQENRREQKKNNNLPVEWPMALQFLAQWILPP